MFYPLLLTYFELQLLLVFNGAMNKVQNWIIQKNNQICHLAYLRKTAGIENNRYLGTCFDTNQNHRQIQHVVIGELKNRLIKLNQWIKD